MKKIIMFAIIASLVFGLNASLAKDAPKDRPLVVETYISGGDGSAWWPFDRGYGWTQTKIYIYDNFIKQKIFCCGNGSNSCPVGKMAAVDNGSPELGGSTSNIPMELQENTLEDFHKYMVDQANSGKTEGNENKNIIFQNEMYYRNMNWSVDAEKQLIMTVEMIKK